jgi:hypothetical protein
MPCYHSPLLTYEALCQRIKPGDVIIFSADDVPSKVVKWATRSPYVHVAIALSVDASCQSDYSVLIAEAHVDARLPSVRTEKRGLGVQIQWLTKRLDSYRGLAWWAELRHPLAPEAVQRMQTWLKAIELEQIPYDFVQAIAAGIESATPLDLVTPMDESALFCSELVVYALQIAGAIAPTTNPAEQTPADVVQFPCFQPIVLIKDG